MNAAWAIPFLFVAGILRAAGAAINPMRALGALLMVGGVALIATF